jgi:hypothetical protein
MPTTADLQMNRIRSGPGLFFVGNLANQQASGCSQTMVPVRLKGLLVMQNGATRWHARFYVQVACAVQRFLNPLRLLAGNPEQAKVWRLHQLVTCTIPAQGAVWALRHYVSEGSGSLVVRTQVRESECPVPWQREPDRNTPAET